MTNIVTDLIHQFQPFVSFSGISQRMPVIRHLVNRSHQENSHSLLPPQLVDK